MRPIETVLILANLLSLFVLVFPLPHAVRWMRLSQAASRASGKAIAFSNEHGITVAVLK